MAVDTYALTSLANVTAYTGISGADTLLENLINRVSDKIETYCDRHFKSRTWYEKYDGDSTTSLLLRNYPVTLVGRVCVGGQGALTLSNTIATGSLARAMWGIAPVSDTDGRAASMVLLTTIGATTTTSTIDLTNASYDTLSELVTYINTLGAGWTATLLSGYTYYPSSDLIPVERREITLGTWTIEIWGQPESDYETYRLRGELILSTGWPPGCNNIFVEYTAGYATIPDDLEQICIELVKQIYDAKAKDPSLTSESLGDYSWTAKAFVDFDSDMRRRLQPWRRFTF